MTDLELDAMDPFEARFARRLGAYADIPVAPVDAAAVAHDVVRIRRRPRLLPALRVPAAAWVLLALVAAAAAALLAGALVERLRAPAPPLVLALESGLYTGPADARPDDLHLLRDDGSFLLPRWSPSGDRIAVLHGPAIPPQVAAGGAPRTGVPFDLVATELLLLDTNGSTRGIVEGPFTGFAWSPPDADGHALLAARQTDGNVVVVDEDGNRVASLVFVDATPVDAADAPLRAPGIAWSGPRTVLAADRAQVVRMDVDEPHDIAHVVRVDEGQINDLAMSPDGLSLAFVVADCGAGCRGEVRIARVEHAPPSGTAVPPPGRGLLVDVEASAALSWADDGRHVIAWPLVGDSAGGATMTHPVDEVLASRDVVAAWARFAADGSGRAIVINSYPFFNDRHFDAWIVDPGGAVHRLAQRTLGFDLRNPPGSAGP